MPRLLATLQKPFLVIPWTMHIKPVIGSSVIEYSLFLYTKSGLALNLTTCRLMLCIFIAANSVICLHFLWLGSISHFLLRRYHGNIYLLFHCMCFQHGNDHVCLYGIVFRNACHTAIGGNSLFDTIFPLVFQFPSILPLWVFFTPFLKRFISESIFHNLC